jgi:hypothetical protein
VNDLLVLGMVWVPWGLVIGRDTYDDLRSPVPLQWYQGRTRARAVVVAVVAGICWPAVLIVDDLRRVPAVFRWLMAFITWRHGRSRRRGLRRPRRRSGARCAATGRHVQPRGRAVSRV